MNPKSKRLLHSTSNASLDSGVSVTDLNNYAHLLSSPSNESLNLNGVAQPTDMDKYKAAMVYVKTNFNELTSIKKSAALH